ncbi:TIGR04104 family putative zinc finger protein [Alteribacter natronophilus]|uniref:TIGR04104 family putative zinc finger protein n=1 Tax=Alteribacter natronophilus TaxID=2583810 RepID=UPI00110DDADC|nr:TIGR04104 family putative zinc finger protein [Alteribacter natronophilus]TMW72837.1 hypothetical protein FGB90_00550 [Alteribacter natronophilus]
MKLPVCWSCRHQFTYREGLRFLFRKNCPACGKKQYVTTKSNLRTGIPAMLVVLVPGILIRVVFEMSFLSYALVMTLLLAAAMMTVPFFVETSEKEEPLV